MTYEEPPAAGPEPGPHAAGHAQGATSAEGPYTGNPGVEANEATEPGTATRSGGGTRRRRDAVRGAGPAVRRARELVATAVLTVAVLAALALALGAVLVGLSANVENTIVAAVLDLAHRLDGPFADVFTFASRVKQTLVNWAIAAAVYLIAGRVLERLIRPVGP